MAILKSEIPNLVYVSKENGVSLYSLPDPTTAETTAANTVVLNLMSYILAKHS
jgi:hypothetical protein|tara:strand:+ start:245 stop:403 length:159 start_codon:yes stop_codon:yes gene_type:complete